MTTQALSKSQLAHFIDHTLLKPEATTHEVIAAVHEANAFKTASVCVSPAHVQIARVRLFSFVVTIFFFVFNCPIYFFSNFIFARLAGGHVSSLEFHMTLTAMTQKQQYFFIRIFVYSL
jgi:hypothetical protein